MNDSDGTCKPLYFNGLYHVRLDLLTLKQHDLLVATQHNMGIENNDDWNLKDTDVQFPPKAIFAARMASRRLSKLAYFPCVESILATARERVWIALLLRTSWTFH